MKRITVVAQREELPRIEEAAGDSIYNVEPLQNNLVRVDIYVNDAMLDSLIPKLQAAVDLRRRESVIEVSSPDFVISSALKRRERGIKGEEKLTIEELLASSRKYTRLDWGKAMLTVIAGLIALIGLFMNNVPIIIGAMLLSPLLGPIYSFVINTAVGRARDAWASILNLSIMLILVVVTSFLTTLILGIFTPLSLTPEILLRFDTTPIYMLMAILLGFAAVFAYAKGLSESIAGIAVAAALVPPLVVSGIALALYTSSAPKPILLSLENVLGLMAGSLIAIIALRIEPRRYYEKVKARKLMQRMYITLGALLATILALTLLL